MNEFAIIDFLTYRSYAHNRKISPEISPSDWSKVFGPTEAMEQQYQKEQAGHANQQTND